MKKGKTIAGCILAIVFAFLYAHIGKSHAIYDVKIDSSEYIELGVTGEAVVCEFVSEEETMDAIELKCQIYNQLPEDVVKVTLTDVGEEKTAAVMELPVTEIKNGKFNAFAFDKVENCKGKTYQVSLESKSVGFYTQKDGTLIMRTITERFDIETFCVLLVLILYIVSFFKVLYRLFSR